MRPYTRPTPARSLTRSAPAALAAILPWLLLWASLVLLAPRSARAQAADSSASRAMLARHDAMAIRNDSLARGHEGSYGGVARGDGTTNTLARWRRGPSNAGLYGLMLTGGVVYNLACPLGTLCDRDAGGYVDSYHTIDKVAHASTAAALTSFAIQGGVQPEAATLLTIAAGAAFELTQTQGGGYYSGRDVVANSTGALLAWGWHRLSTRSRAR